MSSCLVPLRPKYLPQHHILEHHQPMFLPQTDRPSFTPVQNNRQNYRSECLNLYIFGEQTGKHKVLYRMIVGGPWLQSALDFFMNGILICYGCSQISVMFHYFKGFITCLYVVILSCMLVSDMTTYLVFSTCTSKPVSLLATTKAAALLGAFARLRKATVSLVTFVCPSLRHGTTRLPLNGFSWNLIYMPTFRKSVENSGFSKIGQE